jgi:hypothetical protein
MDFARSRCIHFARFAILDDPDRGPDRRRLLYSSNYDGSLDDHLGELVAITADMNAIWGCCEAYPGPEGFSEFIRAHQLRPEAFYIAFRGESVARIQQYIALRRRAQPLLDVAAGKPGTLATILAQVAGGGIAATRGTSPAARTVRAALARLLRALPVLADLPIAIFRYGFGNVFLGARQISASLDRYTGLRWINRLTRNKLPAPAALHSTATPDTCALPVPTVPGDEFPSGLTRVPPNFREDVVAQNQLTVLTVVRPGQADRVRAVMSAIDSYARRLAPDGSLVGISTIHFVRWILLDNGRRLMMVSDYDGTWEAYIDEFAEMILSGLNAIWETSLGYPPDGAGDLPAFKQFLRNHQVPSELFYSAYPDETVLNILGDRRLAHACADAARGSSDVALQQV